jgi:hypothetical protein
MWLEEKSASSSMVACKQAGVLDASVASMSWNAVVEFPGLSSSTRMSQPLIETPSKQKDGQSTQLNISVVSTAAMQIGLAKAPFLPTTQVRNFHITPLVNSGTRPGVQSALRSTAFKQMPPLQFWVNTLDSLHCLNSNHKENGIRTQIQNQRRQKLFYLFELQSFPAYKA